MPQPEFGATFNSDGTLIHYLRAGSGPPLVLLHGWSGDAYRQWGGGLFPGARDVIADLAQDFTVIAPDARGHGLSDKPTLVKDYGNSQLKDLENLLIETGFEQADFVAYSMSAMIGLSFAFKFPSRVRKLILGDSVGYPAGANVEYVSSRSEGLRSGLSFGNTLALESPLPEEIISQIDHLMGPVNHREALVAASEGYLLHRVSDDDLAKLQSPTLLLCAEHGASKEAESLLHKFPNGELKTVAGADHLSLFLSVDFTSAIRAYLAK